MEYDYVDAKSDSSGVELEFRKVIEPEPAGKYRTVGRLGVRFRPDPEGNPQVSAVELTSHGAPLTGTEIRRFAWTRWLQAARTIYQAPESPLYYPPGDQVTDRMDAFTAAWAEHESAIRGALGHPGSKGRRSADYHRIADLYQALVSEGEQAPVKRLAEELGISRNTVSGWISKARELGYLPKGHQGKAG